MPFRAAHLSTISLSAGQTVPEILEKVNRVTSEDVQTMARRLFVPQSVALALLGNLNGLKITRDHLAC
jgi:predicted Zn-dependent peptidase